MFSSLFSSSEPAALYKPVPTEDTENVAGPSAAGLRQRKPCSDTSSVVVEMKSITITPAAVTDSASTPIITPAPAVPKDDNTLRKLYRAIEDAAKENDYNMVAELGAALSPANHKRIKTLLTLDVAISKQMQDIGDKRWDNYAQCIQLIRQGACQGYEAEGFTLLTAAAYDGKCEWIQKLVECGCYVNRVTSKGSPLSRAAQQGHLDAVKLLLKLGADPHQTIGDGKTALTVASNLSIRIVLAEAMSKTVPPK